MVGEPAGTAYTRLEKLKVLNALRHLWLVNRIELSALLKIIPRAQRLTASMVGEQFIGSGF